MKKLENLEILKKNLDLLILLLIIYIGFYIRAINVPDIVADYDPWWYYRHSVVVLENLFNIPKWDILSFHPPGRPYEVHLGVEYTLAIFYKIVSKFINISFMQFFIIAPAIISGLSAIPAYIAVRYLTRSRIAALFSAFFAVLAPSFIGYSVAGYMDSKAFVVFYSFLSIFSLMLAMKRKDLIGYITAIFVNLLFIYTWASGGWYPLIAFLFFIPAVLLFRIFEEILHKKSFKIDLKHVIEEAKSLVIPFLIVMFTINIITYIWLKETILNSILSAFEFAGIKETLLVNISVAELQSINIFSLEGFQRVANSVGFLPTILTLFGLPALIMFKIFRREKIAFEEIFLFLFALITFYMILHGVRFALIFSVATSLSAGYVIGNFYNYLKSYKNQFFIALFLGTVIYFSLDLFSNAYVFGEQYSRGYGIGENWKNALDWLKKHGDSKTLVATWWDPGHIIAGYTGLKVHADGAHCSPKVCIPYDHNIRIQDMGRIFSTSNEEEAYSILKKYTYLTKEQCEEVKKKYGDMIYDNILKEDPCNTNITKVYFIASSDLIGKYYWLTYFGTGTGRQYLVLPLTGRDREGNLVYGNGILTLAFKDDKIVPILNVPQQGIFNMIVRKLVFVYQGNQFTFDYSNVTQKIDGLVFSDGNAAIYMDPLTANSMFTRLYFFNGEGLRYFKLVYSNPEVKIFEVNF